MKDRSFQMLETNGVTLRTVVEGDGPLLVLLHGFPQCWYLWRNQIDPLVEAGYKVAVPDQRGYGGSSCPPEVSDYNIRELAADVAGLPSALGYDEFTVIGHDWGCAVAWSTALLHEDVCKAVLGLSVPYFRGSAVKGAISPKGMDDQFWYIRYFQEPGVAEADLEADLEKSLLAIYYSLSADSPPQTWMNQLKQPRSARMSDALLLPDELPGWLTREDLDYYVEQYRASGFRGPINWYRNLPTNDQITRELDQKKFSQPAAFIAGSEDDVLLYSPDWRETMPRWYEDLRFIELIEGAGHWVQLEKPKETTALVLRFLDEIRS